jgi:hypothetical protein
MMVRQTVLAIVAMTASLCANATDLSIKLDQAFMDRVTQDMTYPYPMVDTPTPCDPASLQLQKSGGGSPMASDLVDAAHQKENKNTEWSNEVLQWSNDWTTQVQNIETNKAVILKQRKEWKGPSDQELADLKAFKFPFAACVTHERVTLDKKPSIKINPPGALLGIPSISAHAHVKIFFWNPFHKCNREVCLPVIGCLCYSWDPGWDPIGGGFDLGTDHATAAGKLTARAAGAIVFLDPSIDKLRFAHPWEWIPLERFVNGALKPLQILDVRDIKISLDVLGLTYFGKSVSVVSGPGSLEAAAIFEKH